MPTLPKNERLRSKRDFSAIFRENKKIKGKNISLLVRENSQQGRRVAFVVSKKVGNAVKRNKIKRLLRESYRRQKYILDENRDVIFIAKSCIVKADSRNINTEVTELLQCI